MNSKNSTKEYMQKQTSYLVTAIVAVTVGAVAFFGGMQYQLHRRAAVAGGQFGNRAGGLAAQAGQRGAVGGQGQGRNSMMGGNRPLTGEIISQDDTSMAIKMQDGSTKIVILSDKTTINKASEAAKADLKTGETVTVFGTANQDGSVTAQNVSLGMMMKLRASVLPIPAPKQ